MRTNIDIDDGLMRQAMKSSGSRTKRAAVEAAYGCWFRLVRKPTFADFEVRSAGRETLTSLVWGGFRISGEVKL